MRTVLLNQFYPSSFLQGKPAALQTVLHVVLTTDVLFEVNLAGSQGYSKTVGTSEVVFTINLNGAFFGYMRFAAGASTATFNLTSETLAEIGDVLEVIAPASQDATFADFCFSIVGVRG